MRILILNSTFPGPFRLLATELGSDPANRVLFVSESGQKVSLPGVRRLRQAPPMRYDSDDLAEREVVRRLRRAARAGNVLLGLRRDGFVPNLILSTSSTAGSFYLRDVFPDAFQVVLADWFYNQGESHSFFNRGRKLPSAEFAPARIRNAWEYNAIGQADLALISSTWQRSQYPECLAGRLEVVHGGIDTNFFSPASASAVFGNGLDLSDVHDLVSFSGSPRDKSRGFAQFAQCMPALLAARPACHVLLAWPQADWTATPNAGKKRTDLADIEAAANILGDLCLEDPSRDRIHLIGPCSLAEYRRMLRCSAVHVYLTAPFALSSGILEAMSCACLVVGSATEPVEEVVQDGVNGFTCDFWDAGAMAEKIAATLARSESLTAVRDAARRTVLHDYESRTQVAKILQAIFSKMQASGQGQTGPAPVLALWHSQQ